MKKGVFIVIDGTDGSGKATQTKLLVERIQQEDLAVETISFPQYGQKSAGCVENYLAGEYGSAEAVGPYRASVFFAVDRYDASAKIHSWLESGKNVIADRYVGANMGHQGSKIYNQAERGEFFKWDMDFEHQLMGIPKPDLNIILHMPVDITLELMRKRHETDPYKNGQAVDMHEEDREHLNAAEQVYLELAEQFDNFCLIECAPEGELLSREAIHELIWQKINSIITL